MSPAVLYPDVETAVVSYLRTALAARPEPYASGVTVTNRLPATIPDRAVWVRDDGGPDATAVTKASRIGVNVFTARNKRDEGIDLANLVRALLKAAPGSGPFTFATSFTGPVAVSDETERPRFYITCELHVRGTAL